MEYLVGTFLPVSFVVSHLENVCSAKVRLYVQICKKTIAYFENRLELNMYANAHTVFADTGQVGVGKSTDVVDLKYLEDVFYTE